MLYIPLCVLNMTHAPALGAKYLDVRMNIKTFKGFCVLRGFKKVAARC